MKSKTLDLIENGYLKFERKGTKKVLRITKKGENKLKEYEVFSNNSQKKVWDGKWRMVIYDVWENQKNKRDIFRKQLKNFGFKQLQGSVWIYPHECEEFVSLLKANKKFGNNVRYIITEKIDNDYSLRQMFKLHNLSRPLHFV